MNEVRSELHLALRGIENDLLDGLISEGRDDDFNALRELIEAPDTPTRIRRQALYAVARWPKSEQERIDIIARSMTFLNEVERVTAINALGQLGGARAADAILPYASDPAPDVRRQVAMALDKLGTTEAMAELRRIAEADDTDFVRARAEELLRRHE